ncbi:hypothetical protein ACFFUB_05920 [Algimonas porphyrae]|uniref:Uncharacterized protein n=1 Tax=Algimonas porphyrae TaxID=1128113 RepID=A0ABQ5V179_9PROT|nr:hypothetical protein [Algimonas porphyrae]GLQ21304.1 hypothetical protein GCM10007854_22590 [Algimonas porphyrae]
MNKELSEHNLPRSALILAGIAGMVSAITTFLLWYLPRTYQLGDGFEGIIALHAEPAYMVRLWVNYVHVFLALGAYMAVAAAIARRARVSASVGLIAFIIWCAAEDQHDPLIGFTYNDLEYSSTKFVGQNVGNL